MAMHYGGVGDTSMETLTCRTWIMIVRIIFKIKILFNN